MRFLTRASAGLVLVAVGAFLTAGPLSAERDADVVGKVFTLTNSTDPARGNEVVVYDRLEDGTLVFRASFATGGLGSGPAPTSTVFGSPVPATADGLGAQGGLILNGEEQLFAVNAGSNTITSFDIDEDGLLTSRNTVDSGGVFPVSLTFNDGTLFVLNSGAGQLVKVDE